MEQSLLTGRLVLVKRTLSSVPAVSGSQGEHMTNGVCLYCMVWTKVSLVTGRIVFDLFFFLGV